MGGPFRAQDDVGVCRFNGVRETAAAGERSENGTRNPNGQHIIPSGGEDILTKSRGKGDRTYVVDSSARCLRIRGVHPEFSNVVFPPAFSTARNE